MHSRRFLSALLRNAILTGLSMLSVSCGDSSGTPMRVSENSMAILVPDFLLTARGIDVNSLSLIVNINGNPAPQERQSNNSVTVSLNVPVNQNVAVQAIWFHDDLEIARLNRTILKNTSNENISISNSEYITDGEGMDEDQDGFSNLREIINDTDPRDNMDFPVSEPDFDMDGIADVDDADADGDGLNDLNGQDNFVDLDSDGFDDITFLTEAEANAGTVVGVSPETPCGGEPGTDNASANDAWNDNCVVKRASQGGQFADSLFSVGIQRVLFCSGFGTGTSYRAFADGEFAFESETATIAFQQAESLAADGAVGPQTWARLQERVELLAAGTTKDTYGFTSGICADIPLFYQKISFSEDSPDIVRGGWTLARNQPNEAESVPFSFEEPFGRL